MCKQTVRRKRGRAMLTRKCDICGAEMRITTPRYKVTFDGWLYTQEKDICIDCFKRIADEIRQAEPTISKLEQVDKDINVRCKDEPQTCDTCKFELYCPEMCKGCCEWDSHYEPKDEPQAEREDE